MFGNDFNGFGRNNGFCDDNFLIILLLLLCNDGFGCGHGRGHDGDNCEDNNRRCNNNEFFIFIIIILFFCNKKGHGNCLR
ncbi:hypothetical protein PN290_03130 [Romboutsia sp. 1001216sp1]|uniref:hypothetical protein n=1 Tax=Romboutsia TaxID=1501226 RepID=UPI000B82B7A9|nr:MULTISPECIES: hypothetical protein [Romboutsia]MDB8792057.1 hypothetical protein [Romboutsia sp. 1001216sp1]MDB8792463.1 hypothetical protein [Romboutsia sp. 1001216sp1]MDB8795758.1 hypothetical protein [Romboutsia sp. 1001216sp1]MDB8798363.1 hypothetical protein [Romboutsia sp. 1001216sp1]MDB8800923.1 hypothetical protein [Romboutsia sp. 1001216sp1]